ncbi:MAG: hypothetical protein K0R90_1251 [Oscillospiraceae bacterium]|nr:hypothetical protein [Oscillospiraceae bacterium]
MKKGIIIIVSCLVVISFLSYSINQKFFPNRAYQEPGSRWVSTDPDIVYWVNQDGLIKGEMKYNGKTMKINIAPIRNVVRFSVDNGTNIGHDTDLSFRTGIKKSSNNKIVLQVYSTNIPGYDDKKITFIRSK